MSVDSTSTKLAVFFGFSTWNTSFANKFYSKFSNTLNFHFKSDICPCIFNYLTLYQQTNATKHIFPKTPLMTVGTIKLNL